MLDSDLVDVRVYLTEGKMMEPRRMTFGEAKEVAKSGCIVVGEEHNDLNATTIVPLHMIRKLVLTPAK